MKGLRTQESQKFNRFWKIVQKEASKQGCIFFADCGEGRDIVTETMEGEDFIGWLIPEEQESVFEPYWKVSSVPDQWIDNMVWMDWELSDDQQTVKIKFKTL